MTITLHRLLHCHRGRQTNDDDDDCQRLRRQRFPHFCRVHQARDTYKFVLYFFFNRKTTVTITAAVLQNKKTTYVMMFLTLRKFNVL